MKSVERHVFKCSYPDGSFIEVGADFTGWEGKRNKHTYTVGVAPSVQLGQQVDTHHFVSGVTQWCPGCNKDEWDTDLTCKHSAAVRN